MKLMRYQTMSDDVIGYMLEYLPIIDIFHFGIASKQTSSFLHEESSIWKAIYCRYVDDDNVLHFSSFKEAVKEESIMKFDITCLDARISKFTCMNNDRTIISDDRWLSVKTTKKICDGRLYSWECTLDIYRNDTSNAYKLFIGLANQNFPFLTQDPSKDIIGLNLETGFSFNCGICQQLTISGAYQSINSDPVAFQSGDVIRCIVDTREPCSISSANFTLSKVESPQTAKEFAVFSGIELTQFGPYYPAVSLVEGQISIKRVSHKVMSQSLVDKLGTDSI
jgi:hypothetical protein